MEGRFGQRIDPGAWDALVAPGTDARLLAGLPPTGPRDLPDHRSRFPAPPRARRGGDPWLIEEVELAGLLGRGGADFPTARKWRTVAAGAERPVVVVNGAEGEPAAAKDALLLARMPHLVIDGALYAAAAVGADRVFLCVGDHAPEAVEGVERALRERRKARERAGVRIELRRVPDRYVAGESGALVSSLEGNEPVPVSSRYRTAERGYRGRPTLVQNAETLAHVTLIMANGAAWFRSAGTPAEPGTRLVSVSGAVPRPVVMEVEAGASLRDIVEAAGADPATVSAVLIGGYYGTWVRASEAFDARLSAFSLEPYAATPGCGVVHLQPADACGVTAVARLASWFARESAGQCGPCVFGLGAISEAMAEVRGGEAGPATFGRIERWIGELPGRGGCSLPDGAAQMLRSGLAVFSDEFARHRLGRCGALLGVAR